METFIKIFNCCNQEEARKKHIYSELEVPVNLNEIDDIKNIKKQNHIILDNPEPIIIESPNIKSNGINITLTTLNNTNNTTNNNIIDDSINNKNYNNKDSIIDSNNNLDLKISFSPSKKRVIYSNSISHNYLNINKIINNNLELKKNTNSLISKSNASNNKKSNNTLLTLNDLKLINQNQDEKNNIIIGCKLLLSGELFFWKEIIISSIGIKNSLRKQKDDHVFFGIKNITNNAGDAYNDLIINFFYKEEDNDLIETDTGRAFEIFYNKRLREYFLHFIHPNLILYYKINTFVYFIIGRDYYFLLGNIFISINVKKVSPIEKIINIQIEIENNRPINYSFNQNQAPIKIGRANCDINIFNSSISKKHGVIEYSKNSQTFYYKDLGSTNGSTLIIKSGDNLKLKGEMNFKLEDVPFKIQEIP